MTNAEPFFLTSREELMTIVERFPELNPKVQLKFVLKDDGTKKKWNALIIRKIKDSIGVEVVTGSGHR